VKKCIFLCVLFSISTLWIYSEGSSIAEAETATLSMSPITLLLFTAAEEDEPSDFIWLSLMLNFQLPDRKEIGFGTTIIPGYIDFRMQHRKYQRDDHSGFFYGPFALVEYRKLYWEKDSNSNYVISPPFFGLEDNGQVYHSIGARLGMDVGYRFRTEIATISPYIGVALPVFYCFDTQGSTEIKENWQQFYWDNLPIRAVNFGIMIDFGGSYLE